jgi:hypothetical protein
MPRHVKRVRTCASSTTRTAGWGSPTSRFWWSEKDTLEPVAKPIAQQWQMRFASSRGYGSLSVQHDAALALNKRFARTKQLSRIYFVSDLDPSGLDLQRAWTEALDDFGVRYHFTRVALTPQQVRDLDLEHLSIQVKPSDSRSKSYVANYGDRAWEADVLPADVIEQTLEIDIGMWLDTDLWNQRDREIQSARALL